MASSKEVFALRKEGSLDKAYEMALVVIEGNSKDEWNIKALAYCLIDLIKRTASQNDYDSAQKYCKQLDMLRIDKYDEILVKTVRNAKLIANPQKKIIIEAKQLSFDGKDQEAYPLFKKAVSQFPDDLELVKNYGWTLYKLLRKAIEVKDKVLCNSLLTDYKLIENYILDDKLLESMNYAKDLANDEKQIIRDAKDNSKKGNHQDAIRLFREAVKKFPDDKDLHEQFAWELHKEGKLLFESEVVNALKARQLLAEYIKLKNEKPSQLHSLFLRFADKITNKEEFNLVSFLKLWNLKNLREEDFESFTKDEHTYPSIAEKIIQHGAKQILDKKMNQEVESFLPFLDIGIRQFKENIWLTYYKAKLLHLINRNEEAIGFLIPVVKEKISEYWVWSLLAELIIDTDKEIALSCYSKSLLCSGEDKFLANVRLKITELLIQKELWNEARFEIASAIKTKEAENEKISDKLISYQQCDWYKKATNKKNNNDFYSANKKVAEEFIFQSLPWYNGCLGDTFTTPEKPDKPRRKIFIKLPKEIIEIVVSDRKFNTSRNYRKGDSIRVKGEYDKENNFQLFLLEKRDSEENWDIFEWYNGNIVQSIKKDGDKNTAWRVSFKLGYEIKEGVIDVKDINEKTVTSEGTPVFVRFFQKDIHHSFSHKSTGKESRVHIHAIKERVDGKQWDIFPEKVGIVDHINNEKGIAHFIVSKEIDSIIKLNQLDGKVEIGSKLLVQLRQVNKDSEFYHTILNCKITNKEPEFDLLKPFKGSIRLSDSFGFVDDIFIENSLIVENDIEDNNGVSGIAIINFNKRRNTWGWKAIKILTNESYQDSYTSSEFDESEELKSLDFESLIDSLSIKKDSTDSSNNNPSNQIY